VFKIKLIKNVRISSGWIAKGTVLVARKRPGSFLGINSPYQVIEGPHAGEEIPVEYAVVLPAERMYSESEYNKLRDELIERREEVAALREEKRMLQEEINQLVAEKKVVLPPEVANAFDKEFGSANEEQKQWGFSNIVRLHPIHLSPEARKIKDYFHAAKYLNLAQALIYGYTVEQTLEQRIRQGVQKIYEQWTQIPSTGDDQADGADLAERITKFVAAELKL
jgi:membrane peptidoglycan carboxypeptidase